MKNFTTKTSLANDLGITRQALNYRIRKLKIEFDIDNVTDKQYFDLLNYGKNKGENVKEKSNDKFPPSKSEIELLKREIDEKNNQIKELHLLLNQSQQLQAQQFEKIELLEQKQSTKLHWWQRLFS